MRESLKKDIADMIKMGVIRESDSPYASPVVVVKKKDNTNRVCVDYRKLNKLTVIDPEPMPTAEHLFQKLSGDKFFTKIDLSKGYWQITIPEEDIPKAEYKETGTVIYGSRRILQRFHSQLRSDRSTLI